MKERGECAILCRLKAGFPAQASGKAFAEEYAERRNRHDGKDGNAFGKAYGTGSDADGHDDRGDGGLRMDHDSFYDSLYDADVRRVHYAAAAGRPERHGRHRAVYPAGDCRGAGVFRRRAGRAHGRIYRRIPADRAFVLRGEEMAHDPAAGERITGRGAADLLSVRNRMVLHRKRKCRKPDGLPAGGQYLCAAVPGSGRGKAAAGGPDCGKGEETDLNQIFRLSSERVSMPAA